LIRKKKENKKNGMMLVPSWMFGISVCVCVRTIANPRRWTIEQSVKDLCIAPRQNEQYRKKNRHHHHRNNNNIIVAGLWAAGPFRVIPIRKILFFSPA
jgi:hypothetical protein